MKLTFFGAARKVTGSMFLLELEDDYRILIDCGTDLSSYNSSTEKNKFGNFPFDASLLNTVFLTHAHIDHSGQIPNLYVDGFEGQVLCTYPTIELTELLLHDAANLNAKQFKRVERSHKKSKKWKGIETQGLYLRKQVEEAIGNFVPIPFLQKFKFKDNGFVTFYPAGHLLGAAHIVIEVLENGILKKIGFSGDIGRKNFTLLNDPQKLPQVDYLIMESTYGNRTHIDKESPEVLLKQIIEESCLEITGRLIIPAFSVGRTQCMLYTLNKIYEDHNIKPIKVFTDSPLARASTKVYEKFRKTLNKEANDFYEENENLFDFENLHYLETDQASKAVSNHTEPCIIISSSGMIKGGRIEHHIEQNIENPYATILMIGYATEDSIGGKLLAGDIKELSINNKKFDVRAKIRKIDVFSGHGDLNDLIFFAENQDKSKLKNLFLVHGEINAMENFKNTLENRGISNVVIPFQNQIFEL
jgi:metallo-beta-lactamase family protein